MSTNIISKKPSVLISVLNWNSSIPTCICVESLLALINSSELEISIIVIDNGSSEKDWDFLRSKISCYAIQLLRQERNLGFSGGHNIALKKAINESYDYIWLVNNDAIVKPNTLERLVEKMKSEPQCGAASPLILAIEDEATIDFCGARHDWAKSTSVSCTSIAEAAAMEKRYPNEMWLMGAAIFLRVEALKEVGILDDRLFAYYEDNDLCARLSSAGWRSRMVFDAVVLHNHPKSRAHEKGAHYFYLMARNSFFFWMKHTPKQYRRLLRLKLIDRAILMANRLHHQGLESKSKACLLGVADAQIGRSGEWNLERKIPFPIKILRQLLWKNHSKHL
jgi:GT2 family glycosyltransferase